MLPRILEPEVMDTEEEVRDYDAMDHTDVNGRFCDDVLGALDGRDPHAVWGTGKMVLDVGTGTARIAIELARRRPGLQIDAMDLGEKMLALAERNVERAMVGHQIRLARSDAKATGWAGGSFDAVLSNSVVHHIPEAGGALTEMWRLLAPGGLLFVRDLARPADDERVREIVLAYGARPDSPDPVLRGAHDRQRALFEASLRAALTVDEIRVAVAPLGVPEHSTQMTSDRHWTLAHFKP